MPKSYGPRPAFLSVTKHFPPQDSRENELYGYRAKLQLAYLFEPTSLPKR